MTAPSERKVGEIWAETGSIYSPGWQVVECVRERYHVVRANFGNEDYSEAEARAYAAELIANP